MTCFLYGKQMIKKKEMFIEKTYNHGIMLVRRLKIWNM